MSLSAHVLIARVTAVTRRTARERRKQLEHELSGYQTESDLIDFEAMLDRYPAAALARDVRQPRPLIFPQAPPCQHRCNPSSLGRWSARGSAE